MFLEELFEKADQAMIWFDRPSGRVFLNRRAQAAGFFEVEHLVRSEPAPHLLEIMEPLPAVAAKQVDCAQGLLYIEQNRPPRELVCQLLEGFMLRPTEIKIVWYVYQGWDNAVIAEALGNKIGSVRAHLHRIFQRLGVKNRASVVRVVADYLQGLPRSENIP